MDKQRLLASAYSAKGNATRKVTKRVCFEGYNMIVFVHQIMIDAQIDD